MEERLSTRDMLEIIEEKYEMTGIITVRTLQNWINELKIKPVTTDETRQADIRYSKKDFEMLLERKEESLKKNKKNAWRRQVSFSKAEKIVDKANQSEYMTIDNLIRTREQDSLKNLSDGLYYTNKQAVEQIIKDDMLELCFKKLFPKKSFDEEKMIEMYSIKVGDFDATDVERAEAIRYMKEKEYIKNTY
ncbi:hypothetical protein [Enterococcus caccae]|uniref:Uncharacterized protein n=1 Tax=Enterococcus caccae ATCC BAA-1240 TaxID=1158612 RepID=R3WAW2_9ENTE|nr:hypothetical protein [Enterococcus caccae]EOL45061.1 hypothetical protein UC7_01867 [Enterococcus caccae ATCC BAA-1240]EOT58468.1 hypothetical protein I580_02639 [Enterococcus caccae ATCC BAA-1240]